MTGCDAPNWNLLQVVAWVYVGDRSLVSKLSDGTNGHGTFWQQLRMPDGRIEWTETRTDRPGPTRLMLGAASMGGSAEPSFDVAENTIMVALQRGVLTASGVRDGDNRRATVPSQDWGDLEFSYGPDIAVPRRNPRTGGQRWLDLRFHRNDVLALWPDPLATAARLAELREASARGQPTTAYISIVEALTWVANRQVRTAVDFTRSTFAPFSDDVSLSYGDQLLELRSKPGNRTPKEMSRMSELAAAESGEHSYFERIDAAEQEIFEACRAEQITLIGKLNTNDTEWIDIPPRYFLHPVAVYLTNDKIMFDHSAPLETWYDKTGVPEWHHVKARTAEILAIWPPASSSGRRTGSIAGETNCQRWLEGLMREGGPIKAKRAFLADAQSLFGVSQKGFARAWANAIATTGNTNWSRPGRKSCRGIDTLV